MLDQGDIGLLYHKVHNRQRIRNHGQVMMFLEVLRHSRTVEPLPRTMVSPSQISSAATCPILRFISDWSSRRTNSGTSGEVYASGNRAAVNAPDLLRTDQCFEITGGQLPR